MTDQSAHGTVSWSEHRRRRADPDGRPDFASNPFNGPQPTYDQLVPRTCWDQKVNQGGARPGCIRRTVGNNLASPDSQYPFSCQGSIGFQRQLGATMAIEADYVYWQERITTSAAGISTRVQRRDGQRVSSRTRSTGLPFPEWGTVSMRRNSLGRRQKNHSCRRASPSA